MVKALLGGRRLAGLDVPTAVASHLWRAAILPRALYGCEIHRFPPSRIWLLVAQSRQVVLRKPPLSLPTYAATEVIHGPPLGA